MDSRAFVFLTIMMLGLLGWVYFFEAPKQTAPQEVASSTRPDAAAATAAATADNGAAAVPTSLVTVTTPNYIAVFDERGGRLSSFKLVNYTKRKTKADQPDEMVELVNQPNRDDWSMRLSLTDDNAPKLETAPFLADQKELTLAPGQKGQLNMVYRDENGLVATRTLIFDSETYLIGQKVTLENGAGLPLDGYVTMRLNTAPFKSKANSYYEEMGAYINGKLVTADADDARDELRGFNNKLERVDWIGFMDQYFLTALVTPDTDEIPGATPPALSASYQDHGGLAVGASRPLTLAPGKKAVFDFDFYYGPKSLDALKAAGHNLDHSFNLGWFGFLAGPLAMILKWMYGWCGNYGVAIILVTVLIKIVLWPLTAKSYRSMKAMQKLQPKIVKLREKYADDKEAMNREIMQLYKTFKINPMGGCLPMLLQIPFFIAFYRVLDSLLELRGAPFVLWIKDLAAPDRLGSVDFTLPFYEPPTGIPVLTLLMGASMVLQQKMTPNTMGDPIQAKMMMLMPVIFTFILINMPAGLVLYWFVNNILSIGQQRLINRPEKPAQAHS